MNSNKIMSQVKPVLDTKKASKDLIKSKNLIYQRLNDDFINTITNIFSWAHWVGMVGSERFVWKLYGLSLLSILIGIIGQSTLNVVTALGGWSIDTAEHRSVTARLAGTMFYTAVFVGMIQCNLLLYSWKEISKYWISSECTLNIKYMPADRTLKNRVYKVTAILLFFSLGWPSVLWEYSDTVLSLVSVDLLVTLVVYLINTMTAINLHCQLSVCLKKTILKTHGFMLLESEYSEWIGVLILFMSVFATIVWNLQDLFIILISMGLTSRYKRLNECVAIVIRNNNSKKIFCNDQQTLQVYTWRKIREAYIRQALLVRRVDNSLGLLILIYNFFNFYFICFQLYLGISQGPSKLSQVSSVGKKHFNHLVHLIWLCARSIYTLLSAAEVHQHSRLALPYLYECCTELYNIEIERLVKQLRRSYVALTGMGFFYVNRGNVLQMAGIVVTYVLVLVQYDGYDDQTLTNSTETSF